ncbi:MAG: TlpA disulfide reductase family protein [Candidatus Baltobacteraceae bacterium]
MWKRSTIRRAWLVPACAALAFGALCAARTGAASRTPADSGTGLKAVRLGAEAPDFGYDVGAGARRLRDERGRPVVLNFWATWCAPCLDELPAFDRLERTFGDRVRVVSLSDEAPGVARTFVATRGLVLPVDEDPQRAVFDAYSIGPIPVTVVLDARGRVTHVSVGELDWKELSAAVSADLPAGATTQGGAQALPRMEPRG